MSAPLYGEDLAAIHAEGFGGHARGSAPGLLAHLAAAGLAGARVVDLGCGAGEWLAALNVAGHEAVGWEPSPALVSLARRRAPEATVHRGGVEDADLAGAAAVTAIGEVFNYLPPRGRGPELTTRLRRIARALPAGGLLLFDLVVAGEPSIAGRGWMEGRDWHVATEFDEDGEVGRRRIVAFRGVGPGAAGGWRRSEEVHRIRMPRSGAVLTALREAGFTARVSRTWGGHDLLPRRRAFVARRR